MKRQPSIILIALSAVGIAVGAGHMSAHATSQEPTVVATVPVGAGPWGVAITPDSRRAFVGNSGEAGGGNNVSVIDLTSQTVIRQVSTRQRGAAGVAVALNGEYAYMANYTADGSVSRIDTTTYTVVESPRVNADALSLAVTPDDQFVYVVCEFGQTWRLDTGDMTTLALVANQAGGTFDIAVNATQQVYSGGSPGGQVGIVGDGVRFATLTTSGTAVALSPNGNTAYVGDSGGRLYVFDLTATPWNTPLATYALGGDIRGIAITPDGTQAYVTDRNGNSVRVVELSSGDVLFTLPVGNAPQRVAIAPDGLSAVVTNNAAGTVTIIAIPARPASGEPGTVPVAPLQQFAIRSDEDCTNVPSTFTDFPGMGAALLHAKWGKSWAQWPNGGRGGFVCTRQPFYTAVGTWSVQ